MAAGGIITTKAKNLMINRTYKSSPDYTAPTKFQMGIGTTTPVAGDTALAIRVPIENGTVSDDGSNTLTGSNGGDDSVSNTDTFKQGAGVSDATSQSLITNDSSATKQWSIADLASAGADAVATSFVSIWLYIKDAAALAMFLTSGTALEVRIGSDTSNYYSLTRTAAQLAVGWNWVTSAGVALNALPATLSPDDANLDTFEILITTNNATDDWTDADVIYDLLRQWTAADVINGYVAGYPTFDESTKKVTLRYYLNSLQGNGFNITEAGSFNTDGTPILFDRDVFTEISKSNTDEIAIVVVNTMV